MGKTGSQSDTRDYVRCHENYINPFLEHNPNDLRTSH